MTKEQESEELHRTIRQKNSAQLLTRLWLIWKEVHYDGGF